MKKIINNLINKLTSKIDVGGHPYINGAPNLYVDKEHLCNLTGSEFMHLKDIAYKELHSNLMIDDRLIESILDRLSLLEKRINSLTERQVGFEQKFEE